MLQKQDDIISLRQEFTRDGNMKPNWKSLNETKLSRDRNCEMKFSKVQSAFSFQNSLDTVGKEGKQKKPETNTFIRHVTLTYQDDLLKSISFFTKFHSNSQSSKVILYLQK